MNRTPRWFRLFSVILALVVLLPQGILAAGSAPQGPVIQTGHYLYLPLVLKGFTGPNLPVPNLAAIDNADHDGSYTLSWTEAPVRLADWYLMQEATNDLFTLNVRTVATTTAQSLLVTGIVAGTYYYRVQGHISGAPEGPWSNIRSVSVCGAVPYNETLYYNMDKVKAPQAWACTQGGAGIVIAVIDTGADSNHPDLAANLISGAAFVTYTTSWEDDNGHGTHVSGIAAGVANNNTGSDGIIFGVAPRAKIMPVKVCNAVGRCLFSSTASGIIWATDHGAKVINMSLGDSTDSQSQHDAVIYAYNHGVVIICAAGNSGDSTVMYPGSYAEVMAVAATDQDDDVAYFSTRGTWVDVAAPGYEILSSYIWYYESGLWYHYVYLDGTSMAAPHVTGEAALIRKLRPAWTVDQVYAHIRTSVDDVESLGFDIYTGWGRIDAQKAVDTLSLAATDALPVPAPVQSAAAPISSDPAEFSPGVVLFKLRPGAALAAILNEATISAASLQAEVAVAQLGVLRLNVPAGEELYWLKYLRSLPDVAYAELDGIMHIQ